MMNALKRLAAGLALSVLGVLAFATPASANASFDFNLTFADGSTAVGNVMIFMSSPNDFVVNYDVLTGGANGFEYKTGIGLPSPQFADGNLYLTFNRPGYLGFFQLVFNAPISGNGAYTLNLAASFECIGGFQSAHITDNTCSHGTKRFLNANDLQEIVVPEPASIALFGSALVLFAFFMRRRKKTEHL
jgi:hypothetical protein